MFCIGLYLTKVCGLKRSCGRNHQYQLYVASFTGTETWISRCVNFTQSSSYLTEVRGSKQTLVGSWYMCISVASFMGATLIKVPGHFSPCSFNPRTRKGCDNSKQREAYPFFGFNPRTRKGCDQTFDLMIVSLASFNPRTRKGCDYVPTRYLFN